MSSDERQQSTAVLVTLMFLCLWVSHYVAIWFPLLTGIVDLRQWLRFWNKPIIVHWPIATVLFVMSCIALKKLYRRLSSWKIRTQSKQKSKWDEYLPIK